VYCGFYQLTRLTRDRGSLRHDDRIDCLAEAVGYWQDQLRIDQDRAEKLAKERAMNEEIRKWMTRSGISVRAGTGRSFMNFRRN
jgi:hypothetical protein